MALIVDFRTLENLGRAGRHGNQAFQGRPAAAAGLLMRRDARRGLGLPLFEFARDIGPLVLTSGAYPSGSGFGRSWAIVFLMSYD